MEGHTYAELRAWQLLDEYREVRKEQENNKSKAQQTAQEQAKRKKV